MKFTISGKINGRTYSVDFIDGEIRGHDIPIQRIEDELFQVERGVLNIGGAVIPATISDPQALLWAGQRVFGSDAVIDGETPELPDVPEGAVA